MIDRINLLNSLRNLEKYEEAKNRVQLPSAAQSEQLGDLKKSIAQIVDYLRNRNQIQVPGTDIRNEFAEDRQDFLHAQDLIAGTGIRLSNTGKRIAVSLSPEVSARIQEEDAGDSGSGIDSVGLCVIESNEGSGVYTVTRVHKNGSSWTQETGTDLVNDTAYDINGSDAGVVSSTEAVVYVRSYDTSGVLQTFIDVGQQIGTYASPETVGSTGESETADTNTWDVASQGAYDGANVVQLTRMSYSTTSHKLYGYYRTFKYDSKGLLVTISGETRVEIDEAESC